MRSAPRGLSASCAAHKVTTESQAQRKQGLQEKGLLQRPSGEDVIAHKALQPHSRKSQCARKVSSLHHILQESEEVSLPGVWW
ncbi:hypothetical protein FKM82_004310 [Ascaphus truei]